VTNPVTVDNTISKPACCVKRSYCCTVSKSCCRGGSSSQEDA
jgi:hypothetical protein